MADRSPFRVALLASISVTLAGCGQKGPLYLPDAPGEVVTRPAATPPDSENTSAPNSPRTPDAGPVTGLPAPEVTAPVGTPEDEAAKKNKDATPPPPQP